MTKIQDGIAILIYQQLINESYSKSPLSRHRLIKCRPCRADNKESEGEWIQREGEKGRPMNMHEASHS